MRWNEHEDNFIINNYGVLKTKDIAQILNKTWSATRGRIFKLKDRLKYPRTEPFKKQYNKKYFTEPNIQNSYWAGFIAADGCIRDYNHSIKISLSSKDESILFKFIEHINFNAKLKYYNNVGFSNNECVELCLYDASNLIFDLNQHWNITPRKSLTLKPPSDIINGDLALAYIIGLFDGDGSWSYVKHHGYISGYKPILAFVGTEPLLKWVQQSLGKIDDLYLGSKVHKAKDNLFGLSYSGETANRLRHQLLTLVNIPWRLKRKWWNEFYIRQDGTRFDNEGFPINEKIILEYNI